MDGVARLQPFCPVSTSYETYQLQQQSERYRKKSNLDIRLFLSFDRMDQSFIGIESKKNGSVFRKDQDITMKSMR